MSASVDRDSKCGPSDPFHPSEPSVAAARAAVPARPTRIAVIGAGPVGSSLALLAARGLPQAQICLYDRLPTDHDLQGDARTIALSLGSLQLLQQLGVWSAIEPRSAPIRTVHVSQQQPALLELFDPRRVLAAAAAFAGVSVGPSGPAPAPPQVCIRASEEGVPQLGAVASYGSIAAALRTAWLQACEAAPQRLQARFGVPVDDVRAVPGGAEVLAGPAESYDVVVIAEGGVFAEQARKSLRHDYRQSAWVGTVTLADGPADTAWERFTPDGPLALLPLPDEPPPARPVAGRSAAALSTRRAALVWCVPSDDDPVAPLSADQRLAVLAHLFPPEVGRFVGIGTLKVFPLGLQAERSLARGRCVCIGNAAQTLHPVAGQGLNLGLRDAWVLLRALQQHPGDIDAALARLEARRMPDRWGTIAVTDFLARSFTWDLPGLTTLRGAGLAALHNLPPLRSWLARRMMFGSR